MNHSVSSHVDPKIRVSMSVTVTVTVTVTDNLLKHKKSMFSSLVPGVGLLCSEPQLPAVITSPLVTLPVKHSVTVTVRIMVNSFR